MASAKHPGSPQTASLLSSLAARTQEVVYNAETNVLFVLGPCVSGRHGNGRGVLVRPGPGEKWQLRLRKVYWINAVSISSGQNAN